MLVGIREEDPRPLFAQIAGGVKEQVRRGELRPGDELPSVRELAGTLGINLHTVHRAYQALREEGVIRLRLGQRARIAPLRDRPASAEAVEAKVTARLRELVTDAFHLGLSRADFRKLVDELLATQEEGEKR